MNPLSERVRHVGATDRAGGFTLLEVLVVIIIVGIIATVATLSVGVLGGDREMQHQAERIGTVLEQAKEECELQGYDVGMRIGTNHYEFLRFNALQQTWEPIENDDLFAARDLPAGLRFRLWLEGREVVLSDHLNESASQHVSAHKTKSAQPKSTDGLDTGKDGLGNDDNDDSKDGNDKPPQIMVLSSGDVNSFELRLDRDAGELQWKVFSKPDGTISVERSDATDQDATGQ